MENWVIDSIDLKLLSHDPGFINCSFSHRTEEATIGVCIDTPTNLSNTSVSQLEAMAREKLKAALAV
ncbi:hypothetical protein [Salinicola salarius]|uniref:hypothetical protein n=1 Tax=Salinicola salarius TaxID=430457 RepID=UPI000DA25F88|nr:hypothetical protein [Salinicola salarius]